MVYDGSMSEPLKRIERRRGRREGTGKNTERAKALELVSDPNWTYAQIAVHLKVAESTVQRWVRESRQV